MLKRLKKYIIKKILEIIECFKSYDTLNNKSNENINESNISDINNVHESNIFEKKDKKILGNNTLFDKVNEIKLEIYSFKKYSLDDYKMYSEKLTNIEKEIEKYYEEEENKDEIFLKIMSGAEYFVELQLHLQNLLEDVKRYKKEKYNYKEAINILKTTKEYLSVVYLKLLASKDTEMLESAYSLFYYKLNEVFKLDIDVCTSKKEEICKLVCECIYNFMKCNYICDSYCDVSNIRTLILEEKNIFWEILLENVAELFIKIEEFKNTKYYSKYESCLQSVCDKYNTNYDFDFLLNEKFMNIFVLNEKKIIELHLYYSSIVKDDKEESNDTLNETSNKVIEKLEYNANEELETSNDKDYLEQNTIQENEENKEMVKIDDLKKYILNLTSIYENDEYNLTKFYLWYELICNFKYDITYYEVYKLIYFLGLKTFLVNHLKNVEENNLLKKVFESQKNIKINFPKKSETNMDNLIKIFELSSEKLNLEIIKKLLSKLSVYFKEEIKDNNLVEYYCSEDIFTDCEMIMKNLNKM